MQVYDSAQKPLEGDQWWAGAGELQALAVCQELVRAYESGNPETFKSGQPIRMDGSAMDCALRLLAATKRRRQQNLWMENAPAMFTVACALSSSAISAEASREPPANATEQDRRENGFAKLVNGLIDRKVVKQTVMTSVYGVTFIGARRQIQGRLEEKLVDQGMDVDEAEAQAYGAASYVAHVTMDALQELFTGARTTMNWLGNCARIVAMEGQPMSWVTPWVCRCPSRTDEEG